jgi:hypothetical protein
MKKFVAIALFASATAVCLLAQQTAQSNQSLGDVARQQRAQDQSAPAHKVWTDEDFPNKPATDKSTEAAAPTKDATNNAEKSSDAAEGQDKEKKDDKDAKKDTVADQDNLNAEWKAKIDAQKAKIADLQREQDLTDREYKLATTTFYADAGNRLRDQKDFTDKEVAFREKLGPLKQQISDEQAKLAVMQDEAHKAGANKAYD